MNKIQRALDWTRWKLAVKLDHLAWKLIRLSYGKLWTEDPVSTYECLIGNVEDATGNLVVATHWADGQISIRLGYKGEVHKEA